jgi:CHAD domain-containing protein
VTRLPPPSVDPATRLLKERTRVVFRHLPKALAGDEEEVHQMRVAARRLRVSLPLLAPKPRGRRVREAMDVLRGVTRTASLSRDLDVGLLLFDERLGETEVVTPELRALRRALAAARNRGRKQMAEGLLDLEIARLRRHLAAIQARGGETVFTVFARLRKAAEKEHAEILVELDSVGTRLDAEALHGVRTRCRRLRYTAEVLDEIRSRESGVPGRLRGLQETLGRLHDAHVLANWLQCEAEKARGRGRATLANTARREGAAFLEKCRDLHGAFLASEPRAVLAEVLSAMIPSRSAA